MLHFSNINQSSFKGAFMFMFVQHLCTSILYSVIISALHGPLISNDSWLSAAAINQHWRSRPQEVCYWAEPTRNRRRLKQRDRLPFFALLMSHNNGPAPGLPIGSVFTKLLWIISQGGEGINNNMGTIKCRRQCYRTEGFLSPYRSTAWHPIINPAWMAWAAWATFSGYL